MSMYLEMVIAGEWNKFLVLILWSLLPHFKKFYNIRKMLQIDYLIFHFLRTTMLNFSTVGLCILFQSFFGFSKIEVSGKVT